MFMVSLQDLISHIYGHVSDSKSLKRSTGISCQCWNWRTGCYFLLVVSDKPSNKVFNSI